MEANTDGYKAVEKQGMYYESGSGEQMKIFHGYGQPKNKTGKFFIAGWLVFPAL
ncbi:MAG: hypothetical protein NTV89_02015 [Proteobacteria bacterium]|nr:hypothetical protein [Pseudomonadota bacterium]